MAAGDVRLDGSMTDIRITAGTFGEGVATYENGVFRFPNGEVRGVEDLADPGLSPETTPEAHWSGDIVRGLQGALATSTKALPSPFGFAASFVGLGLDVLESSATTTAALPISFSDGASATMAADGAVAAIILRDREVVRLALERRAPAPAAQPAPAPEPMLPASDPNDPTLTSMFQYEKRKGRLRRVVTEKTPQET
ncbi:hypothetical protein MBUL_04008 [Methylobacterium bullatum]|uniref:Uncharacterized protein n=1 Tax=Methylobacterium bullatum TaxID=570505 RepID=A0A679JI54_9HYPH|nr:hypothetical protein MBUL_04008 [Methylobacterium bullatum]